jgi:hypothetical protein
VNEAGTHVVGAGRYQVSVGGGQPGATAAIVSGELEMTGEKPLSR